PVFGWTIFVRKENSMILGQQKSKYSSILKELLGQQMKGCRHVLNFIANLRKEGLKIWVRFVKKKRKFW
ncbi:MAG: hypothetical protein ABJN51_03880, partial [Sneathiella sp.]